MSSIMAQRVAINKLAQSYMAFNTNYHDTGLFGVYAVSDPKHQAVDDLVRPSWLRRSMHLPCCSCSVLGARQEAARCSWGPWGLL